MNRIYRLIWSKALKCIVAVAENTNGRGKDNTKSQAVGGAPALSQVVASFKKTRAPPSQLKLISLRNAIPAIAISAGLLGIYSGEVQANCNTIGSDVTCTGTTSLISNTGSIATFSNSGTILGTIALNNTGSITLLSNSGTISASSRAIENNGLISVITNTGVIAGNQYGLVANLNIDTINIGSGGAIRGDTVTGIYNVASIASISIGSGGLLTGGNQGIDNYYGTITSINNAGTISGGISAINNEHGGVIRTITNSGLISSINNVGFLNTIVNTGTITDFNNQADAVFSKVTTAYSGKLPTNYEISLNGYRPSAYGQMSYTSITGVAAGSMNFSFSGSFPGPIVHSYQAIFSGFNSSSYFGGVTSGSSISGHPINWIISQKGNSNTWDLTAFSANTSANVSNINSNVSSYSNTGSIYGLVNIATVSETLFNSGTVSGGTSAMINVGAIGVLRNSGTISGSSVGVVNSNTIGSISNTGVISSTNPFSLFGSKSFGILNTGTIGTINNSGAISGASAGISNYAKIDTITNTGQITGIVNTGLITTLNNQQGKAISTPLAYSGVLPTNYNIIITGLGNYGQLAYTSISGTLAGSTNFGITSDSTITANNYADIFSGLTSSNFSSLTGTFGSYSWVLTPETIAPTHWDLVVSGGGGGTTTTVTSGSNLSTASLVNSTITSVALVGGTLVGSSAAGSVTQSVAVSSTGSAINQNLVYTTLTGVLSGSSKLTIVNPSGTVGAVAFTADNSSFSGGFQVNPGAKLQVGSGNALGTGSIDLVGTTTTSATLATTADMTIANAITVAYDPTFDVTSGTTLTVSSPITNGTVSGTVVAGDVVVTGGGTLDLTAVNTYTGGTTITSGSALALTGNGSIADSSGVYNYGTFDVTGSNYNTINLNGFTQGSNGTLRMNIAPTTAASQSLQVAGSAVIGGSLYVNGSSGSYVGNTKYTIVHATGGLTGTFSGYSSNLPNATKFSYDANDAYLSVLAFSTANTQQSLVNTANSLQGTYALQNSVLVNSFSYDCNDFGPEGVCISVGGRNTSSSSGNGSTSALLIGSYRATDHVRLGAYFDQNLSASNPGGTVQLANNTPLVGLFGAWAQNKDGTGPEIKLSAAYGQKNTTITRQVVNNTEPGSGNSTLYSSGAQLTGKYGFAITDHSNVAPYIGIRYAQNNMSGYTEGMSASVQSPLTYQNLNTSATTAIAGIGASHKITPKTVVFGSVGVEQDLSTNYNSYVASGINGLTPVAFNSSPVNTRGTASLGLSHELEKNQWISINGAYRQAAYQSLNSTSVMLYYTIGM